jgi:CubicO group peptidase (beta-lactamase class C family)
MTKLKPRVAGCMIAIAIVACAWTAAHTAPRAAAAPSLSRAGEQAIDALLRDKVAAGIPAIAVIVVNAQQQLFLGAAGQRDVAAPAPLAADAIFRIASMTKPVTSLATMMLVEQGRIAVDDPVAKYLPEFERVRVLTTFNDADGTFETRPPARPITIRHLLTHTSGIAYPFVDARLAKMNLTGKTQPDIPLAHDPGERFTYGPSTAVLGTLIAKMSGRPLDEFVTARIFDPLGMSDTFYTVPADKHDRVVTLHTRTAGALEERRNPATLASSVAGDGGLFSTAADYGRFMQLFLNGGRAGTVRLVSESTIRQMMTNQIGRLVVQQQPSADPPRARPFPFGGGKDTFGFGFQIEAAPADSGLRTVGSASWGGINNTHFWIDPRTGIGAAVLMQVLPYYDEAAIDVLRSVERLVYRHVRAPSSLPRTR